MISCTLPGPQVAAIDAEARRRLATRGQVLADFVATYWATYVARCLRGDLAPVIDTHAVDAATPPALPTAHHERPSLNAAPSLPPARPKSEPDGDGDAT